MSADKFTECISCKVTPGLKALYDTLTPEEKKHCKADIMMVIEQSIHRSRFKIGMYSGEGGNG